MVVLLIFGGFNNVISFRFGVSPSLRLGFWPWGSRSTSALRGTGQPRNLSLEDSGFYEGDT